MRVSPVLRRLDRLFIASDLRENFRPLTQGQESALREALARSYFSSSQVAPGYLETAEGRLDYWMHVVGRVDVSRTLVVPWLNSVRPLRGARVLEIGCGTGGGTVALAEQGALVTGLDVQEQHMEVARRRCELHGVAADFICANAADLAEVLHGRAFEFVIFFAALEHMTLDERLASLAAAFELIARDGFCIVLDAPNRLWPFDNHTAWEPFFHWLPDEIAVRLGANSRRAMFAEWCSANGRVGTELARWGRGVSYHEFELAIGRGRFEVVSSLEEYWRGNPLRRVRRLWSQGRRLLDRMESERTVRSTSVRTATCRSAPATPHDGLLGRARDAFTARACKRMLRSFAGPSVHDGFLDPWLQLILRPVPRQPSA